MTRTLDAMSTELKPRLRGVSHQIAFFIAVASGLWLVATAGSAPACRDRDQPAASRLTAPTNASA